ncbi:MAG: YdiU family protein [Sporomusaceae bacterium]|nr:YdiU family protein [Sporomusaceae bacterium]
MSKDAKAYDSVWNLAATYRQLPALFYRELSPQPVRGPKLAVFNDKLALLLGLDKDALQSRGGVAVLAGNEIPPGAKPLAQAYAGHQFGHFTMLGDGRAVLLGEQVTPSGEVFDVQLKGSGLTPFSRGGDGRAALGPMLREYIISEAMHGLKIPTTRSLAVVTTGEPVMRETALPGAVLTRIAASHIRVGTFEYAANWGTKAELKALADYTLKRHFREALESEAGQKEPYLTLLREMGKRQAWLIARWQLVGFIHGVMNTDNMAISGETIDYGPCAFMDRYDEATVFSSIDRNGRYAYGNQPKIGAWNLARFAESLLPLLHDDEAQAVEAAHTILADFAVWIETAWFQGMREKLGLFSVQDGEGEEANDLMLIQDLLGLMKYRQADYTNTFRGLTLGNLSDPSITALANDKDFADWHSRWQTRLSKQGAGEEAVQALMKQANPAVIPRNHRVEAALAAAVEDGDYSVMDKLLAVLQDPYAYTKEQEEYASLPESSSIAYKTYCGT